MLVHERLTHLIEQQMPSALLVSSNPLFDYESRRVTMPNLKKYMAPFVFLLLLITAVSYKSPIPSRTPITWMLVAGSMVLSVVSDLYYMALTVNTIGHEIESGQWDILRMTALRRDDILTAKYVIAQVRAWRMMVAEIALRLCGVAFGLGLILAWAFPPVRNYFFSRDIPIILSFFSIFAVVYVLEPLWRMRAFTAVGLAISARISSPTFGLLAGLGMWMRLRLFQAVIVLIIGFVAIPVIHLPDWYILFSSPDLSNLIVYFLVCFLAAGAVYAPYDVLARSSLRQARKFAFRTE